MKTLKWIGSKGQEIELRARCEIRMVNKEVNLDGYIRISEKKEKRVDAMLELWIDGKPVDKCPNINFWRLVDVKGTNLKKIWGLNVGMTPEQAEIVDRFLQDVIESGKSAEVEATEQKEQENKRAEEILEAKRILDKASKQPKIMTNAEYAEWRKRYNNAMNEGGEGYIPELVTVEQLEWAKSILGQ